MKSEKWDNYFYSHYRPVGSDWAQNDLSKYRTWYASWIDFIQQRFELSFTGKSALELGCGIGAVSTLLVERQAHVIGSDIADVMVEHAQTLSPEIPFMVYDVMQPYPKKQTFDYVVAFEVLEHIPKLDVAVDNIYSVLGKNGYFIGSTPYPYEKNMIDPTHVNVHLPAFWNTLFTSHGFRHVQTIPLSFPPFIWKIPPFINPIINRYIPYPGFVSTTLIVAKK